MNKKGFALACVAYLVIVMVVATVWHLGLFWDVYVAAGMREQPLFQLGIASMVIQALIVAYLYPRCTLTGAPITRGLKFGLLIGLLMGSYGALAEAGKYDVGPVGRFVFYEGVFFLLQYSIVGMVIGLVYGKRAERSEHWNNEHRL